MFEYVGGKHGDELLNKEGKMSLALCCDLENLVTMENVVIYALFRMRHINMAEAQTQINFLF